MSDQEQKNNGVKQPPICPNCGSKLKKWQTPPDSTWGTEFQYVCFNDECPYFVRGWDWMREQFDQTASYRYRLNPVTGGTGNLPVWSYDAMKNQLLPDDEE